MTADSRTLDERLCVHPEGLIDWTGVVHIGFTTEPDFTFCAARVDEFPGGRVPAEETPGRISCDRCTASLRMAIHLTQGVDAGALSHMELGATAIAYGAAMAATLPVSLAGHA